MRLRVDKRQMRKALLATAFAFGISISTGAASQTVAQINLTTDDQAFLTSQGFAAANHVDPNLINPWGMSFSTTSPFWLSDQGAGVATLYNAAGAPVPLVVSISGSMVGPSGPTGQVFNGGAGFELTPGNSARFIFANLNGTISGWNPAVNPTGAVVAATETGAVYTGLALGSSGGSNFLYAANNAAGTIDVFDANFQKVTLSGGFQDPGLPAGLAPFNVVNVDGVLYVTYATPGPDADEADLGTGVVDRFTLDGEFIDRFVTGDVSNNVLSPWGVVEAPDNWGAFANAILIGNFAEEDGFINAFADDGTYLGMLMVGSDPFNVPYLWALGTRAPGSGFDAGAVYFSAGIGDEEHGLFGQLLSVPEPESWAMMLMGFAVIGLAIRKRNRTGIQIRRDYRTV
jgi:uncharacterized protein (TIGR03118 family)